MLKQIKGTVRLDLRFSPVPPRPSLSTASSSETHHNAGQITHSGYTTHHLNVQHGVLWRPVCHITGRVIQTMLAGKELSASWNFRAACKYHFVIYFNLFICAAANFPGNFIYKNKIMTQKRKRKSDKLVGIRSSCSLQSWADSYTLEPYSSCSPTLYPTPSFLSCCAPDLRSKRGRRLYNHNLT